MAEKQILKSELFIDAPVSEVWSFIMDTERSSRIFKRSFTARVTEADGGCSGTASVGSVAFTVTAKPYDIVFNAPDTLLALRLTEENGGTKAVCAASMGEESPLSLNREDIAGFLARLKGRAAPKREVVYNFESQDKAPKFMLSEEASTHPGALETTPAAPVNDRKTRDTRKRKTKDSRKKEPTAAKPSGERRASSRRGRATAVLACLLAVLVLVAAAFKYLPGMLIFDEKAQNTGSVSSNVNKDNALKLELGMSKHDVERLLGTSGVSRDDNSQVYCSEAALSTGSPAYQIMVRYSDSKAKAVTLLDLERSTAEESVSFTGQTLSSGMTIPEIESAMGYTASMIRKTETDAGQVTQLHFGYLDPFANFNDAWRGEIVITIGADGAISYRQWVAADGTDPLIVSQLKGNPVENQYDDYTVFLNDKYVFDWSMLMLNHFSRGDANQIFGPIEMYDGGGAGVALYKVDSAEILAESGLPAYRMSFGFDNHGYYIMSSYTNMRLIDKDGMLAGSDYAAVSRGMSYGEIRSLMRVMPTAMFVDSSYFTLCYGKRLDTDTAEKQFEFVVRFDIENNNAVMVANNTGAGAA